MQEQTPDEIPYRRTEGATQYVEGLGTLWAHPWAGSIILRTIPSHDADQYPGAVDHVTLNGKDYRLDTIVTRDTKWKVRPSQWGILSPMSIGIGPGTPSAEKKAREALETWAGKYAEDIAATTGRANSENDALHWLTKLANELAAAHDDVARRVQEIHDGASLDRLAEIRSVPYRLEDVDR